MSLFEEMKKLNDFGQRDDPPSYLVISRINSKLDNLIYNIDLKIETNLDAIKNRLHYILKEVAELQTHLTYEFHALWNEIENPYMDKTLKRQLELVTIAKNKYCENIDWKEIINMLSEDDQDEYYSLVNKKRGY